MRKLNISTRVHGNYNEIIILKFNPLETSDCCDNVFKKSLFVGKYFFKIF